MRFLAPFVVALVAASGAAAADKWTHYENAAYGYGVEHPTAGFLISDTDSGLLLLEDGGRGQIDIYAASNEARLPPERFETVLASAELIREITYRRHGNSWLAVSGYYRSDEETEDDLVFYAKFMFSPDRSVVSAFEASYPVAEKQRFEPIVERMEDSLTRPQSSPGDPR